MSPSSPRSSRWGETPHAPRSRLLRVLAGGALVLALFRVGVPVCPMAAITGRPCPGCGLSRATLALLHGHLGEAIALHPLAPLIAPLLGGFFLYGSVRYVLDGRWPATEGKAAARVVAVGLGLFALLLAVWIARFFGAFGGPVPV